MSNQPMRIFSTAFKEETVRRLESGEALAAVSKELGIARKLLYEWRWAWRRHGAAALNRRRGPKPGRRRSVTTGDPPGAALASSALDARGPRRPAPNWPGRRRALKNSSAWLAASSLTSIFFAKPCDLPTRFKGKPRRVARPTLRARQRAERGERVARRKRNGKHSQKNGA
jgi:transposase-like protein